MSYVQGNGGTNLGRSKMSQRRRILFLDIVMLAGVSLLAVIVTVIILYQATLKQQREGLYDTVRSQAELIEAVTCFGGEEDEAGGHGEMHEDRNSMLSRVIEAHSGPVGAAETREFIIAERQGDRIGFLFSNRNPSLPARPPILWSASEAEPMRRALEGRSGTCIAPDYRGEEVLAAYVPVAELEVGLVSKIDMKTIREPFILAALLACALTILVIPIAAFVILRGTRGLLTRVVRSEEHLRKLSVAVEQSPASIVITDLDGNIEYVNPHFVTTTGYTAEEAVGQNPRLLQSGHFSSSDYREMWDVIKSGRVWRGEFQNKRKNGELYWESASISPIRNDAGELTHFLAVKEDITERKQALAALRKSEASLRVVVDAAPDAIVGMDANGRITEFNPAAEKVFEIPRDRALGREVAELLVPPSTREDHRKGLARFLKTGEGPALGKLLEMNAIREDGTEFPMEMAISAVARDGHPTFIATIRDISARKTLEGQLVHARKLEAIGQLAAGIAHEINTPTQYVGDNTHFLEESFRELTPVLKKAQELVEIVPPGTEASAVAAELKVALEEADAEYLLGEIPRALEQSLNGIERVRKIVQSMKAFSHPGAEGMTSIALNQAIENTITVATNEWKYVADVVTDFDSELPPVPCLPGELNQVVLNLIVNAAHAIGDSVGEGGESKGTITIRTCQEGEFVAIRLTDTGTGIPEQARGKIFDPFFTTKEVGRGTGQGLAIVHNVVVQKHGGKIDFETEMGKGTTFCIHLPLKQKKTGIEEEAA